jgi:hypothetical protein
MNVPMLYSFWVALIASTYVGAQEPSTEYLQAANLAANIQRDLESRNHKAWEASYTGAKSFSGVPSKLYVSVTLGYSAMRHRVHDTGTVCERNGRIALSSKLGDWGPSRFTSSKEFYSVQWGSRVYLIESDRIVDFCNSINLGREPRTEATGLFFLREGDMKKNVSGSPAIPEPWDKKYLLEKPVTAAVQSVIAYTENVSLAELPNRKFSGIRCTVTAGKNRGLRPGMILIPKEQGLLWKAYVLKTNATTSEMLVTDYDGQFSFEEMQRVLNRKLQLCSKEQTDERK